MQSGLSQAAIARQLGVHRSTINRELDRNKLHFDIKHLNTLGWTAPQDLADSLAKRILAVVGQGPDLIIR